MLLRRRHILNPEVINHRKMKNYRNMTDEFLFVFVILMYVWKYCCSY